LESSCFLIKYVDGVNRQWTAPWHISVRSPLCMFVDGVWKVMYAMPKGPEVAGDEEHSVAALQDVDLSDEGDLAHFAPHYQRIIRAMNGNTEAQEMISRCICSSKRDGMCFRVLCFQKGTPEFDFWNVAISRIQDPFITAFTDASRRIVDGLVMPASNGTAVLTKPEIQGWMVCAMALSLGLTHDQLVERVRDGATQTDVLHLVGADGRPMVERFLSLLSQSLFTRSGCEMHAFEAIGGPNRMSAFDSIPHTELASTYPADSCGLAYLGMSYAQVDGPVWVPHFAMDHHFPEPSFWEFESVEQCRVALKDLATVFAGEQDFDWFFSAHPCGNRDMSRRILPDPEGFVAYLRTEAFGREQWVYTKAKTWMFYIIHKIRSENIPTILRMPTAFGDAFSWLPRCALLLQRH